MEGIIFQDGVYVYISGNHLLTKHSYNDRMEALRKLDEDSSVIVAASLRITVKDGSTQRVDKNENYLYGGRVKVWFSVQSENDVYCYIDGILIHQLKSYPIGNWSGATPMQMLAAILNDIEQLGVDAFLENYKRELTILLEDIRNDYSKLEVKCQGDSDNLHGNERDLYKKFPGIIQDIRGIIFSLSILLCAGLTNSQYIQAYCDVMATYFS